MPFTGCVKFPSHFWEALASGHGRTRTLRRTLRPFHQDLAESTGPRAGDRGVGFLGLSLVRIEVLCAGAEWEGGGSAEPDAPRITAGEAGGLVHLRGQGVVATPHPCATECDVSSSFARLGARPRGRAAGSCCSGAAVRVRSRNVTSLWASAGCSTHPPAPPAAPGNPAQGTNCGLRGRRRLPGCVQGSDCALVLPPPPPPHGAGTVRGSCEPPPEGGPRRREVVRPSCSRTAGRRSSFSVGRPRRACRSSSRGPGSPRVLPPRFIVCVLGKEDAL